VQSTLGVGGCGHISFGHVLVAVRPGQRRDAVATGEEQLGRCAAVKSKCIRLYLYSGKLALAATYLRRVFVVGRRFAAGAPALKYDGTAGACGTKPRRWPPAALPGADLRRDAWGDGAQCASTGDGAHGPSTARPHSTKLCWSPATAEYFGVDSRFDMARSSSALYFFALAVPETLECTTPEPITFTLSEAAIPAESPCS
jgi:hypothetical protein